MASTYIKDASEMHCVCNMDGSQTTPFRHAVVEFNSLVDHTIIYHMGGFPTIHHNKICDITASLHIEVCHDVATDQPHCGKNVTAHSPNTDVTKTNIHKMFT